MILKGFELCLRERFVKSVDAHSVNPPEALLKLCHPYEHPSVLLSVSPNVIKLLVLVDTRIACNELDVRLRIILVLRSPVGDDLTDGVPAPLPVGHGYVDDSGAPSIL